MDYTIVDNILVQRDPEARVFHIVTGDPGDALRDIVDQLLTALQGSAAYVELYLYTDQQAVAYSGWFAHVTRGYDRDLTIDTTNDPAIRRALYEALA